MKARFYVLFALFALVTLVWIAYLFSIQVFDPFNLSGARLYRYTPTKEILIPTRGSIMDVHGNLLVSSISYYQIDIDREAVKKWAENKEIKLNDAHELLADLFAQNTSVSKDRVLARLRMKNAPNSLPISNRIKEMELDKLLRAFTDKDFSGYTYVFSKMQRIYSKENVAAPLLGSVTEVSDGTTGTAVSGALYTLRGLNGIESVKNKELSGEYGWREVVLDAYKRRVPYPNLKEKKPVPGRNVWLTIDSGIQEIVEAALYEGLEEYGAKNGGAVVMDPNTGRVLAAAGASVADKDVDPNILRTRMCIPVSFMFEPGSTLKGLTMLAALEQKIVKPTELIDCQTYRIAGRRIKDVHPYTQLTPRQILMKSSNVGISKVAQRIGAPKLYEKYIGLGFGQKSGIELQGESSGMFARLDRWGKQTLHSVSFGQEISITALQLANAYSAVANGGKLMKPFIIDSIRDDNGNIIEKTEPTVLRQVSTKAATDTLKSYLQSVVEAGTGRNAMMKMISIAGKTGTAQKKTEGAVGYSEGKHNAVFMGFFPVEKPQLVISVFYDEPVGVYHYGSMSAAPTFKRIVENILFMPECKILPFNDKLLENTHQMPNLQGKTIGQAINILKYHGFKYNIVGSDSASIVIDQFPKPNVAVDKNHQITIRIGHNDSEYPEIKNTDQMPYLRGMSLRKAMKLAAQRKIKLKIDGSGIVRNQSIPPGVKLSPGTVCIVEASP
ncbi:MAG: penicillin-binding transpeptidase domain-containing protein [Candidatus Cloacimonetes bacterium]|nr:penicillin-binding transpeptidase domain-containing protein [Candidatus Cloacimonadota bacterium]